MATNAQCKYLFALSKQLGTQVEWQKWKDLPLEVATELINDLKKKAQIGPEEPKEPAKSEYPDVKIGMAEKLVTQWYIQNNQLPEDKVNFTVKVKALLELWDYTEGKISSPSLRR